MSMGCRRCSGECEPSARWPAPGTAWARAVATVVGAVGMDSATSPGLRRRWSYVGTSGLGALVVGFVGGSFPATKARRLETMPSESQDYDALRAKVGAYNADLAESLGLTPAEALSLEP